MRAFLMSNDRITPEQMSFYRLGAMCRGIDLDEGTRSGPRRAFVAHRLPDYGETAEDNNAILAEWQAALNKHFADLTF